jgi:translation initiation factor 1 (eIF-1/SUI1)
MRETKRGAGLRLADQVAPDDLTRVQLRRLEVYAMLDDVAESLRILTKLQSKLKSAALGLEVKEAEIAMQGPHKELDILDRLGV